MDIDKELETIRDDFIKKADKKLLKEKMGCETGYTYVLDEDKVINFYESHICRLLEEQQRELNAQWQERVKDIVMDCLYEMEFEVVNAHFVPYDDKGWAKWNDERKQQLDKIDALLSEGKEGGEGK